MRRFRTAVRVGGVVVGLGVFGHVQAVEGAVEVVATWFGEESHGVHLAAVLRNGGDSYVEIVSCRVQLVQEGNVYWESDVVPVKVVLGPGEETAAYDFGPQLRRPDGIDYPPDDVLFTVDSREVSKSEYPYAPDAHITETDVLATVDGTWVRLTGALQNRSELAYRAGYNRGSGVEAIKAVAILYRGTSVVGAERLEMFSGHLGPGTSYVFMDGATPGAVPDTVRVFTAAEPLETGTYPLKLAIADVQWGIVTTEECGNYPAPCRRLMAEVVVANDSDVDGVVTIGFGLRTAGGALWYVHGCSLILIESGESRSCRIRQSEDWWPVSTEFRRPTPALEDIELVSVHASSSGTTHDASYAASPEEGMICYRPQGAVIPRPRPGLFLVYLPTVRGETAVCAKVE